MPIRALFALCLALLNVPVHAATHVTVWSYYNSLPFYDPSTHEGLAPALVAYLNHALAGRYQLELKTVPRARLNMMLEHQDRGIILLAPSAVFAQAGYKGYSWSPAIMNDRQELVSMADSPVEFTSPHALMNRRLGGVRGHTYPALQKDIDKGALAVYRVNTEGQLFDMLMARRLDAGTLAATSVDYWQHTHPQQAALLYRSGKHLGQFTRHFLYAPGLGAAPREIDKALQQAATDPAWQAIFASYGLAPAMRR